MGQTHVDTNVHGHGLGYAGYADKTDGNADRRSSLQRERRSMSRERCSSTWKSRSSSNWTATTASASASASACRTSNGLGHSGMGLSFSRSSISDTSCTMQRFVRHTESFVTRFLAANYFSAKHMTNKKSKSLLYEKNKQVFRSGIKSFINSATSTAHRKSTMACCKSVNSTLQDAMKAVSADTSRSYLQLEQDVVGNSLVANARVLEIIKGRTKNKPDEYVGIKQVSYRSLLDASYFEEFVLLETIGTGVDPDGFKYLYKVLRSVPEDVQHESRQDDYDFEEVDHEEIITAANNRHVTGNMHSLVLVLSESATPNVLQLQVWLDVDISRLGNKDLFGAFTTYHDASSLTARYRALIESYNASLASSSATSKASTQVSKVCAATIKERRNWCQLCTRRVGFPYRRRLECCVCGAQVCSQCVERMELTGVRICTACKSQSAPVSFSKKTWSKMTSFNHSLRETFSLQHKDTRVSDYDAFHNFRTVVEQSEDDVLQSRKFSDASSCCSHGGFAEELQSSQTSEDFGFCKLVLLSENDISSLSGSGRTWDSELCGCPSE